MTKPFRAKHHKNCVALPDTLMKEGLELAKGAKFMGHPLESFTREQLLAIAAIGWKAHCDGIKRRVYLL